MEAEGHGGQSQDPAQQQPTAVGTSGRCAQLAACWKSMCHLTSDPQPRVLPGEILILNI